MLLLVAPLIGKSARCLLWVVLGAEVVQVVEVQRALVT